MNKAAISQQTIHEFLGVAQKIKLSSVLLKLRNKKKNIAPPALHSITIPQHILKKIPANLTSNEIECPALKELALKAALKKVASRAGFRQIIIDSANYLDNERNLLALTPECALAIAILSKTPTIEYLDHKAILGIIDSSFKIPENTSPQKTAAAIFFVHISTNGLDGALADLYFNETTMEKLKATNNAKVADEVRLALYRIQLDFLKKLC